MQKEYFLEASPKVSSSLSVKEGTVLPKVHDFRSHKATKSFRQEKLTSIRNRLGGKEGKDSEVSST